MTETLWYVKLWDIAPGLFWFRDHIPLTKSAFVRRDHKAFTTLGLNAQDYAGHRFHIGAATATAQSGIEDSVI